MHKFRFIHVLLEHMSENKTSNADVAKEWGVHRGQIGRDKQYIQKHLDEFEAKYPQAYKSLLIAAVTYAFLQDGAEVDIDFGEASHTEEPDESQRVPMVVDRQSDGDSSAVLWQDSDVPAVPVEQVDSTQTVSGTTRHKIVL